VTERFLAAADRVLTVPETGQQISVAGAVDEAQIRTAIKGNPHAQRNFKTEEARHRADRLLAIQRDHEFWTRYVANCEEFIAACEEEGKYSRADFPHPDELLFRDRHPVTGYLGGSPYDLPKLRQVIIKVRDILMLQSERDRRHFGSKREGLTASEYMAFCWNKVLIDQFKLNETEFFDRMDSYQAMKKRDLESQLLSELKELGFPKNGKLRDFLPLLEPVLASMGVALPESRYKRYRATG